MAASYTMRVKGHRVIDGDTIDALLDLGCNIFFQIKVRMRNIDTPEKTSKNSMEAEAAGVVTAWLSGILKDEDFQVVSHEWDKYGGRLLGDIKLHDQSVKDMMIGLGYARPYHGGKKEPWKEEQLQKICKV